MNTPHALKNLIFMVLHELLKQSKLF